MRCFNIGVQVLLFILHIISASYKGNEPGSDSCVLSPEGTPLELVFVVDQSSTYVLQKMKTVIDIVDDLQIRYKGSLFGLAGFADYHCTMFHTKAHCADTKSNEGPVDGKHPDYHDDLEGCYRLREPLSTNLKVLKDKFKKDQLEFMPSGDTESGLAGTYLTVADPKMHWTRKGSTGEPNKITFVVSDDQTHVGIMKNHLNWENKTKLKGDGTDSCQTMENPDSKQAGDILKKHNTHVFMLYADTAWLSGKGAYESWKKALQDTGSLHKIVELNKTNAEILEEFDDFIAELTEGETVTCADPPSYNTLGL